VCLDLMCLLSFFFSSRRRHTRLQGDWSSDVCSSDLAHFTSFQPACLVFECLQVRIKVARSAHHRLHEFDGETIAKRQAECCKVRSEERRVGKECRSRWAGYD